MYDPLTCDCCQEKPMPERHIFIVTDGEYSDYRVCGAYSTRQLADEAVAAGIGDDVLECPIDPVRTPTPPGLDAWHVNITRDGEAKAHKVGNYSTGPRGDFDFVPRREFSQLYPGYYSFASYLAETVWAKDEQHAIKIANEHRAQAIAEGRWPDA